MNSNDIFKRKRTLWALAEKPKFVLNGLYSTEKQRLDIELKDLQEICNHIWDETEKSGIVDDVCEICGKRFHNKEK